MRRWGHIGLCACAALAVLGVRPLVAQDTGTLEFDMKNYTSEVKLPKNVQKRIQHAGIAWGTVDNTVVVSLVSQSFIKAKLANLARYGEQQTLDMKPGEYTITCVGYEWNSTSKDPDKNLSKSGFFNNDIASFSVAPGKKTTLEVTPVYVAEPQWILWAKMNLYMPDLRVRVLVDGSPVGGAIPVCKRSDKSIAWDNYKGPLKF